MSSDQKERAILMEKQEFLKRCQVQAAKLEEVLTEAFSLYEFWEDNEYATGMADVDLANFRFSLPELEQFVAMQAEIMKFATEQPVPPADYRRINNQIK